MELFDFEFKLSHTVDITSLGVKLLSYDILDFTLFDSTLLICTKGGEVIKLE